MAPQRQPGRIAYGAVAYFSMLLLILAGCATDTDTAAAESCGGEPSMTLRYGAWSGHEGPIADGGPLPIITSPGGGWHSTIDLDVDNLSALAEISVTLSAPEHDFTTTSDFRVQLTPTGISCQHTTEELGSLYLFFGPWKFEEPVPAVLGCEDLTLSVRYEDVDGPVLEQTLSIVGECDELAADTCGC